MAVVCFDERGKRERGNEGTRERKRNEEKGEKKKKKFISD